MPPIKIFLGKFLAGTVLSDPIATTMPRCPSFVLKATIVLKVWWLSFPLDCLFLRMHADDHPCPPVSCFLSDSVHSFDPGVTFSFMVCVDFGHTPSVSSCCSHCVPYFLPQWHVCSTWGHGLLSANTVPPMSCQKVLPCRHHSRGLCGRILLQVRTGSVSFFVSLFGIALPCIACDAGGVLWQYGLWFLWSDPV